MVQVVEQTREEKIAMYKKCKKIDLINMLINCNMVLDTMHNRYVPSTLAYNISEIKGNKVTWQ